MIYCLEIAENAGIDMRPVGGDSCQEKATASPFSGWCFSSDVSAGASLIALRASELLLQDIRTRTGERDSLALFVQ